MDKIKKTDHFYLIDGSGYIFRAYYALPPLTRKSDGLPTGAVSGFCSMLFKLLEDSKSDQNLQKPTHFAVIFDSARKTFRNNIYSEYKANRSEAPDDLAPQFETSKSNKNFFGIRPENLSLTNEGGLKGSVFGVEYLGSRKIITVKTNIGEIKVKTDISINIKLNENVQIKPANDSIIIFDGETDKSLNSEFMK